MTNKKQKRKLNIKKVLLFVLLLALIGLAIYYLSRISLKNIIISGNSYYTDEYIISKSKLENYPSFLTISCSKIKKILEKESLIENVSVKKTFGFVIEINVSEKKILYQKKSDSLYVLNTSEEMSLENIVGIPLLINYYPNTLEEKAIKSFSKLSKETISKISMIEYSKTEADDERFLFYMSDGNLVYINLNRMDNLNKYTEILNQVGTKKGILNLDSGNFFEIKE
jgi:cell division protein FtsQ